MNNLGTTDREQPAVETALSQAARRLRSAVRTESYEEIPELLAEHHRQLEKAMRAATGDMDASRRLAAEARETLDWVKANVLANRAHAETSLNRLSNAARYTPNQGPAGRTWKFEA